MSRQIGAYQAIGRSEVGKFMQFLSLAAIIHSMRPVVCLESRIFSGIRRAR